MTVGWNDATELIAAGSGEVYTAAYGTTLPTTPTATLDPAFHGLGFVTDDGIGRTHTPSITEFMAFQSSRPIRRERDTIEDQFVFTLMQWNEDTLVFAYGGGAITTVSAGIYRYDPPLDTDQLAEVSLVLDVNDGTEHHRIVVPRGNVTEAVESTYQRKATANLPVTFKALEPTSGGGTYYEVTDSDAFVAGS